MTKIPALTGPLIGDRVRSFDFHGNKDLEGPRACYMEGQLTGLKRMEGCWRYRIEVTRCVGGGQEQNNFPGVIYPPVNGTARMFGGVCDGVEKI